MTDGIVFRTVSLVREQLGDRKEYQSLFDLSDEDVARYLFRSFRKSGVHIRGLRLSNLGLDVLSQCFTSYVIKRPEGRENLCTSTVIARCHISIQQRKSCSLKPFSGQRLLCRMVIFTSLTVSRAERNRSLTYGKIMENVALVIVAYVGETVGSLANEKS